MKKISITAQLAAYTVSMLMGFGTFAAWNYVSVPQEIQMNEYFDMQAEEFEKNYEYEQE